MTNGSRQWFVLSTSSRRESAVRDVLRKEGFRCYVPMLYRTEIVRGHKERRLVPAISGLVFVYGKSEDISDFKLHSKEKFYWLMTGRFGHREKMVVPDKQMQDFIRVTQQREEQVIYFRPDELSLTKGDRIIIHGGPFDGVEGIMLKLKGKREKQLVVSIPDLAVAAVSVKPDVVEVVAQQRPASHNILGDAKELIRLSMTMLSSPPDKEASRYEWDLMNREIQALYQSLLPRKGYIAATEAQLSLALLLAERVMNVVTETTLQRCRNTVAHLRSSKLREQLLDEIKKTTL